MRSTRRTTRSSPSRPATIQRLNYRRTPHSTALN